MSDTGKQIVESLKTVREFHSSVSKLLQLATAKMNEQGWSVPLRSAACGSRGSKALYNAKFWLPEDGFQFYRNESQPLILAYIATIFDDAEDCSRVPEPVITAGWLKFLPDGKGANGEYHYPWCRAILTAGTASLTSGEWINLAPTKIIFGDYYEVASQHFLGRKLLEIKDEATLGTLVLEPLLENLTLTSPGE